MNWERAYDMGFFSPDETSLSFSVTDLSDGRKSMRLSGSVMIYEEKEGKTVIHTIRVPEDQRNQGYAKRLIGQALLLGRPVVFDTLSKDGYAYLSKYESCLAEGLKELMT